MAYAAKNLEKKNTDTLQSLFTSTCQNSLIRVNKDNQISYWKNSLKEGTQTKKALVPYAKYLIVNEGSSSHCFRSYYRNGSTAGQKPHSNEKFTILLRLRNSQIGASSFTFLNLRCWYKIYTWDFNAEVPAKMPCFTRLFGIPMRFCLWTTQTLAFFKGLPCVCYSGSPLQWEKIVYMAHL